jgi:hypothetical protein
MRYEYASETFIEKITESFTGTCNDNLIVDGLSADYRTSRRQSVLAKHSLPLLLRVELKGGVSIAV